MREPESFLQGRRLNMIRDIATVKRVSAQFPKPERPQPRRPAKAWSSELSRLLGNDRHIAVVTGNVNHIRIGRFDPLSSRGNQHRPE